MRRGKPPADPRGGHVRLYWEMVDSPAWRALTHADVRVYLSLRRKLLRSNNGDINATLSEARHAGIRSSSTLAAALARLQALGFIAKTREGGIANGGQMCCLYRFTDEGTFDIPKAGVSKGPATNEWRTFTTLRQARAAVQPPTRKTRAKVRPSKRTDSAIEAEAQKTDSTIEHGKVTPIRPSNRKRAGGI